ncbi:MAG: glycosyltransferase [Kiritimatiellae bacterium]|nr:glycosyltransferase [Kiritimatiellia bacterium]
MIQERLCVVMPVYNEQDAIGPVLEKWAVALDALDLDWEIRAYNDGSRDNTLAIMEAVADRIPRISVHDKPNGGHGPTILQGYREAAADGFDWVFQIDSDDEMGPGHFPELWNRRGGADFLVGRRSGRSQGWARKTVSGISRLSVRAIYGGGGIWDVNTPYRLMRVETFRGFFDAIPSDTFAPNVILSGLAARHGLRCLELPVPQHDRTTGEVSIKKWKLAKAAAKSFRQTLSFGLKEPASGRSPFAWMALLPVLAGLVLTAVFALSVGRAISLLAWMALLAVGSRLEGVRQAWQKLASWVEGHVAWAWALVLGIGTLERWISGWRHQELVTQWWWGNRNHDYIQLWQASIQWGWEHFWLTKSWVTVWYYGAMNKLFGADLHIAYWCTALLYALSAVVAYGLVAKRAGKLAGILSAFAVYAGPALVRHSANIATEHTFVLAVLGTLWLADRCLDARRAVAAAAWGVCAGVGCWLATWSRGEGVLLWMLLPVWLFCGHRVRSRNWRNGALVAGAMAAVFAGGAWKANQVNLAQHQMGGIFCSNDNYWPRLMGCNLATRGHFNYEDVELISERAKAINPQCAQPVPETLFVPLIKEEVSRRWKAMSFRQAVGLMADKTLNSWCVDIPAYGGSKRIMRMAALPITYVLPGLYLLFAWVWFGKLLRRWLAGAALQEEWLLLSMPLFVGLQFGLLLVAESMWRYGYLFHVFWGLFGAMGVSEICKRRGVHRAPLGSGAGSDPERGAAPRTRPGRAASTVPAPATPPPSCEGSSPPACPSAPSRCPRRRPPQAHGRTGRA